MILTVEYVDSDAFGLRIGRVALVLAAVRGLGFLDEQEARRRFPFFRYDRHAASGAVVTDYLSGENTYVHLVCRLIINIYKVLC